MRAQELRDVGGVMQHLHMALHGFFEIRKIFSWHNLCVVIARTRGDVNDAGLD